MGTEDLIGAAGRGEVALTFRAGHARPLLIREQFAGCLLGRQDVFDGCQCPLCKRLNVGDQIPKQRPRIVTTACECDLNDPSTRTKVLFCADVKAWLCRTVTTE